MQKTFTVYNDPSHGWLKAPKALLKELGIADKISTYSYERGADAYLEEDCDAPLLINALRKRGIEVELRDQYTNRSSKIRGYADYTYLKAEEENELAQLKLRMRGYTYWTPKVQRQIDNASLKTMQFWQGHYGF